MDLFVEAGNIIANLIGLGQSFAFADNPHFTKGEFFYASLAGMAGDTAAGGMWAGRAVYGRLVTRAAARDAVQYRADLAQQLKNKGHSAVLAEQLADHLRPSSQDGQPKGQPAPADAQSVSIIAYAITVVDLLGLTTGFGPPDEGDALRAGSQEFAVLCAQLGLGVPDGGWQGEASQAYADRHAALQELARVLAELDNKLAALVKQQADWVTHVRLSFGILKDVLAIALVAELALGCAGFPVAARKFGILVCFLGIGAAIAMLGTLCCFSIKHAEQAVALSPEYTSETAKAAAPRGLVTRTPLVAAARSSVAHFEVGSKGLAATDMSGLVTMAAGPASTSMAGSRPEEDTAESAATSNEASGQAVPTPGPLGNPTVGQLKRLASAAHQTQMAACAEQVAAEEGLPEAAAGAANPGNTAAGADARGRERASAAAADGRTGADHRSLKVVSGSSKG